MRYEIKGEPFPIVTCYLQRGEKMITEGGSMIWMTPNISMETTGGGFGKILSRALSGESLFQNIYTAEGDAMITFGSSFPGQIKAIEIAPGQGMIVQKTAFLAAEEGVELTTHVRNNLGTGIFGGEGFIMQRLSGNGVAFVEIDRNLVEYDLQPGEQLVVDTGNVAGFSETVHMEIQQVKVLRNKLIGGEGLFHTVLTGPGKIWLQTMPIFGVAEALSPYLAISND